MTTGNLTAVPLAPAGVITGRNMIPGIRDGALTTIGITTNIENGNIRLGKKIPRMTGQENHGGLRQPGRGPMANRSLKVCSHDLRASMVKHKAALDLSVQMKAPSQRQLWLNSTSQKLNHRTHCNPKVVVAVVPVTMDHETKPTL